MSDKTLYQPLDDAERSRLRCMSVVDVQKEGEAAQRELSSIIKNTKQSENGKYTELEGAAKALEISEGELKGRIAALNGRITECRKINSDKIQVQNAEAHADLYIPGEKELYQSFAQGAVGGNLFDRLEKSHGVQNIDLGKKEKYEIDSASALDIQMVTTRGGASADPPTGLSVSHPITGPTYEAVDRHRGLIPNLSTITITNDRYTYRKEIDPGVDGQVSNNPPAYKNYQASEGATAISQELGTKEEYANVESVRALATLTREQLEDVEGARAFASMILQRQYADNEENQLVNGSGTSPQIRGLLATTGRLTYQKPAAGNAAQFLLDTYLTALGNFEKVRGVGCGDTANLILMTPEEKRRLQTQKSRDGEYLYGAPADGQYSTLWGVNIAISTAVPANKAIILNTDPRYMVRVIRRGMTMETGLNNDDFAKNQISMAVYGRSTLAVIRPKAILELTDLDRANPAYA